MGVLYDSSRPSKGHLNYESFSVVDDSSCVSFSSKYRSACYPRTASSIYHGLLLVICRVGSVRNAKHQHSPPVVGDQVKPLERSKKAKHKSDEHSASSPITNQRSRSASCDAGTRVLDPALKGPINQSRLGARKLSLDSLLVKASTDIASKPQAVFQAKPSVEFVKDRQIAESRREGQNILIIQSEDNVNPAEVPLPPSPCLLPVVERLEGRKQATASIAGIVVKRQREESNDDTTESPFQFKKAMRWTKRVTVSVQLHDTNGTVLALLAEPRAEPSTFDVAGWSTTDWQDLTLARSDNTRGPHPGFQVSVAACNQDSIQVPPAPASIFSTVELALDEPDISTSGFVPVIQKFNDLVGDCDASARFSQNRSRCLANNKYGKRCGAWYKIPFEDQRRVEQLLSELTRMNFESIPSCINKLHEFTNVAVCPWQRTLIREMVAGLLQQQQQQQSGRPHDTGLIKSLPRFRPYRPTESVNLSGSAFVAQTAAEPFSVSPGAGKELGEGYIYVYWNEATFGVFKIGFTTYNVKDRLKQWETDCNHVAAEQYSSPCKVRHAARVEQLVHADLLDYRVREPACRTCFKSHIEWFRGLSLSFIIGRIETWSQWMSEGPYEKMDGQWRLTNKGRDRMPLAAVSNSSPGSDIDAKLVGNRSRRYNLRQLKGRKPSL